MSKLAKLAGLDPVEYIRNVPGSTPGRGTNMKVLILTTATNRPEIHSKSFESYIKFLNPELDITWLINLDYVEDFGSSLNETLVNIKSILKSRENIKPIFIKNKIGWMNKAVRNLLEESDKHIRDVDCVLYLEDDWFYSNPKGITFLDVFDFDVDALEMDIMKQPFITLLSKRIQIKDVTFQPTIWSKKAFKKFKKIIENSTDTESCPETILEEEYTSKLIRFQYPLFSDLGREWLEMKGLRRPKKKDLGKRKPNYKSDMVKKQETYKEYIKRCQTHDTGIDVTEFTLDVNGEKVGIELPPRYAETIDSIARAVGRKIKNGETEDDAKGAVSKVMGAFDIKAIYNLGEHFAKELSEKVYGGECFVNHIQPYRNNIAKEETASWLWHYDNVAPGALKILIYLTDTTEKTGAFLVLKNDKDEYPLVESSKISPKEAHQPKWAKSRVPGKVIARYKKEGYKEHYIEGPKGTFILFNNNIVHKATLPVEEPVRHCIIYNFRPYHNKLDVHLDKSITWDWRCRVNSKTYDFDIIETNRWKELRSKK